MTGISFSTAASSTGGITIALPPVEPDNPAMAGNPLVMTGPQTELARNATDATGDWRDPKDQQSDITRGTASTRSAERA